MLENEMLYATPQEMIESIIDKLFYIIKFKVIGLKETCWYNLDDDETVGNTIITDLKVNENTTHRTSNYKKIYTDNLWIYLYSNDILIQIPLFLLESITIRSKSDIGKETFTFRIENTYILNVLSEDLFNKYRSSKIFNDSQVTNALN